MPIDLSYIGKKLGPVTYTYTERDVMLYALGVGAGVGEVAPGEPAREDRLVLYGDISKDAGTFVYRVRATNAGVFQAPPAFAEGLYDPKTAGIGLVGKLEIVKP